MKKPRKNYTGEEEVAILRRHLLEHVPISKLCDKHSLQPTVFYRWQKEFFENGTAAFQPKGGPTIPPSRNELTTLRRSRPKMRSWPSGHRDAH
jgi:transposase